MCNAVGVYSFSNNLALVIESIDYYNDRVLVSENGENSKWYDMCMIYNEDIDETETGFMYGKMPILFSEIIRV